MIYVPKIEPVEDQPVELANSKEYNRETGQVDFLHNIYQ